MLRELRVENLALLAGVEVPFGPGLNVVTGTTGAGKSLLLAALQVLLGGRFQREYLRSGTSRTVVSGVFDLPAALGTEVDALLDRDAAPEPAAREILVRRRIDAAGRNRCEVDGELVPVATLRRLGSLLVEIHGQSEHQRLLDGEEQTRLLDRWAGLDDERNAFTERLRAWRATRDRLANAARGREERLARLDLCDAIVREIEEAALEPGEQEALRRERALLADAARHGEAVGRALAHLAGDANTGEGGALDALGGATRELEDTASLSTDAAEAMAALEDAAERATEALRALETAHDTITTDPDRLEEVQERLEAIGALLRRHGPTEEDALAARESAADEAATLRDETADQSELERRLTAAHDAALTAGTRLNDKRRKAAKRFAADVTAELASLGMEGSRLEVTVDDGPEDADLSVRATDLGLGSVELIAATNRGEEPRPLARIASGGELARVALAVKSVLAGADHIPLLVFDEVDADVGPRLGGVIGAKLAALARNRQALVVTHLPQVAAYAAQHVRVDKQAEGDRTVSRTEVLAGAARELEIAEMLRGEGRGKDALDQARSMLDEARS